MKNKPNLFFGLALYLNAWHELDSERSRAEYERIKRSSCFDYACDYDFDFEQTEDLWHYVSRMDREFLSWFKSKQPPSKT